MIEKILIEIIRLKNELDGYSAREALDYIESYINTLSKQQEQPFKELEEEINAWYNTMGIPVSPDALKETARHFANWQKEQIGEQARKELAKTDITLADLVAFDEGCKLGRRLERQDMLKDAVEGYVNYYEDGGGILMAEAQVGCPYHNGDKVKIVIVKEEE